MRTPSRATVTSPVPFTIHGGGATLPRTICSLNQNMSGPGNSRAETRSDLSLTCRTPVASASGLSVAQRLACAEDFFGDMVYVSFKDRV